MAQRANNPAYPGASSNLVDYVLPHFLGIFLANTFFFLAYAALKRGEPMLLPRVTLPGFLSGAMWALAQSAWFIANGRLSLSIAFPLIATGPGSFVRWRRLHANDESQRVCSDPSRGP